MEWHAQIALARNCAAFKKGSIDALRAPSDAQSAGLDHFTERERSAQSLLANIQLTNGSPNLPAGTVRDILLQSLPLDPGALTKSMIQPVSEGAAFEEQSRMIADADIRAASKALSRAEQHIRKLDHVDAMLLALEGLQEALGDRLEGKSRYCLPQALQ